MEAEIWNIRLYIKMPRPLHLDLSRKRSWKIIVQSMSSHRTVLEERLIFCWIVCFNIRIISLFLVHFARRRLIFCCRWNLDINTLLMGNLFCTSGPGVQLCYGGIVPPWWLCYEESVLLQMKLVQYLIEEPWAVISRMNLLLYEKFGVWTPFWWRRRWSFREPSFLRLFSVRINIPAIVYGRSCIEPEISISYRRARIVVQKVTFHGVVVCHKPPDEMLATSKPQNQNYLPLKSTSKWF